MSMKGRALHGSVKVVVRRVACYMYAVLYVITIGMSIVNLISALT